MDQGDNKEDIMGSDNMSGRPDVFFFAVVYATCVRVYTLCMWQGHLSSPPRPSPSIPILARRHVLIQGLK